MYRIIQFIQSKPVHAHCNIVYLTGYEVGWSQFLNSIPNKLGWNQMMSQKPFGWAQLVQECLTAVILDIIITKYNHMQRV